jgi:hypothetical protein
MTSDAEIRARADRMIEEEIAARGVSWFYMSYADENGFRGGCYLQAFGPATAVSRAHIERISPGGEVRIIRIPHEDEDKLPPPSMRNRLLTLAELMKHEPMINLYGDPPTKEDYDHPTTY